MRIKIGSETLDYWIIRQLKKLPKAISCDGEDSIQVMWHLWGKRYLRFVSTGFKDTFHIDIDYYIPFEHYLES